MTKPPIYIRSAFDTAPREITRSLAARLLRTHRYHTLRRIDVGWKFVNGFEPTVISRQPIYFNINF